MTDPADKGPDEPTKVYEHYPPVGINGWEQKPQADTQSEGIIDTKIVYSSEEEVLPAASNTDILKQFTVPELMTELHARFDHIILLGKKSLHTVDKKKELRTGLATVFMGDVHALLGMTKELEDHLTEALCDRRHMLADVNFGDFDDDIDGAYDQS